MDFLIKILSISFLFLIHSTVLLGIDQYGYISDTFNNNIIPINLSSDTLESPISTGGSKPSSIAITPNGLTAYVVNRFSNNVTAIDLTTRTIEAIIDVGTFPRSIAITPNGQTAYVTNNASFNITSINIATNKAETTIDLGVNNKPMGIAITPDGTTAYMGITGIGNLANTIIRLDLATHALVGIPIPVASPLNIAITPDGKKAYVTSLTHTVTPIDLTAHSTQPPIAIGIFPFDLAITSNGETAYVTTQGSNTVTPIDIVTNTLRIPITVSQSPFGQAPLGIAINEGNQKIYVTNFSSSDVTPISLETFMPNMPIPLSNGAPYGFVITPDQAPTASFVARIPSIAEIPTILDASSSTTPVGSISIYEWDFGDGNTERVVTPIIQHVYETSGQYIVTLTVTNSAGTSTMQKFTGQTVRNNGGDSALVSRIIDVGPPIPKVTNVNPNYGLITDHSVVTITGSSFINVMAVKFNDVNASSFQVLSPTTIQATVPTRSTKATVDITVTTHSGTSTVISQGQYIYDSPPASPSNFLGTLKTKNSKRKITYRFKATWDRSPSDDVVLYRIYNNNKIVEEVPATSRLSFITKIQKNSSKGFKIAAVNSHQVESPRVKIKIRK